MKSNPWTQLTVRTSTKAAVERVAKAKRYAINVAVDEAIRAFADRESIELANTPATSSDSRPA